MRVYRYTISYEAGSGEKSYNGGVVIGKDELVAAHKVLNKYNGKGGDVEIWRIEEDDYYDKENPHVFEIY